MTTVLHITTDQTTKIQAQRVAQNLGVPLNKLMNEYLKKVANQHVELPSRRMGKKLERILGEVEKDFKAGKNIVGPFKNTKAAADYLRSL